MPLHLTTNDHSFPIQLRQITQPDTDGIRVCTQTLTIRQGCYDGPEAFQAFRRDLLRSDMFLERLRVDTAELSGIPVCRKSMICTRGVVTAAAARMSKVSELPFLGSWD